MWQVVDQPEEGVQPPGGVRLGRNVARGGLFVVCVLAVYIVAPWVWQATLGWLGYPMPERGGIGAFLGFVLLPAMLMYWLLRRVLGPQAPRL